MSLSAVLTLGFFLGMRHAVDPDHLVAVSAIVSRERSLRAAAPIGVLWGIGHTITVLVVGGVIIAFGVVIPPRVGLGMELAVALMLIVLGALNVRGVVRYLTALRRKPEPESTSNGAAQGQRRGPSLRPLVVGLIHGLAGSAAIALLVLGSIRDAFWGVGYLVIFGVGTIAGMLLITATLAMPVAFAARRFERLHRALSVATGLASVVLGLVLVYQVGFVQGMFTAHPEWSAE